MEQSGAINELSIRHVIELFYARVRADAELGPIFAAAIENWPEHLDKLTDFWSSVLLASGRYKGRPVPAHLRHRDRIARSHFSRWLALWRLTTSECLPPAAAAAMQASADRIALSLQHMLFEFPTPIDRPDDRAA
jgi:hemoglobin